MLLKDKKAVITGAGSGIGFEIAKQFAIQGAFVYLADIDEEKVRAAALSINSIVANSAYPIKMDIANEQSVTETFSQIKMQIGRIDILVNNASIHRAYKIIDFPLNEWEKIFRVNMTGTFLCAREAAKIMMTQKFGVIITVSACSARKADDMHAAYSSAKAAQIEFNRVLALELGAYGIRANCILPGATETPLLEDVFLNVPDLKKQIEDKTIMGKIAKPIDQANAAVFLASDMASHITGEYLVVSGGEFLNP